jgi:asparagine synthase (glutamine-hydrolysing)
MCGISGIFDFGRSLEKGSIRRIVESMNRSLIHRGPDGRGVWSNDDGMVCFGHTRLSIVDPTVDSSQPMLDPTGRYSLTFNGELYNYKVLRTKLEALGEIFRTQGDTEVFLRGLIVWGAEEFSRKADGMFAAAIFDNVEKKLTLIRDVAGEKPLYFSHQHGVITFASELRAFFVDRIMRFEIDSDAMFLYLLLRYVPAPFSIVKGICKLEAGHIQHFFQDGRTQKIRYSEFQIQTLIPFSENGYNKVLDEIQEALASSLASRIVADVPVGLFLSGGIDSTLCAVLAKRNLGVDLESFSVGIEGDPKSEHIIAGKTASMLNIRNHTIVVSKAMFESALVSVCNVLDEPNGDRSCPLTLALSQFARRTVTVAIGGDGGDELFGGYTRYQGIDQDINDSRYSSPLSMLFAYLQTRLNVFPVPELLRVFKGHNERAIGFLELLSLQFLPPVSRGVSVRTLDFKSYLPGSVLAKVDRLSMSASLEVRTPFFHPKILVMAGMLSPRYLSRGSENKPVLRDILRRFGYSNVASMGKIGFGAPPFLMQASIKKYLEIRKNSFEQVRGIEIFRRIDGLSQLLESSLSFGANALHADTVFRGWLANGVKHFV